MPDRKLPRKQGNSKKVCEQCLWYCHLSEIHRRTEALSEGEQLVFWSRAQELRSEERDWGDICQEQLLGIELDNQRE